MSSQSAGRRRSNNTRQYSAEDQALNMISKEAEARLAAKRAARAEAREIRMKEIEKQQKESEAKQDRIYELTNEHAAAKVRQMSGSRSGSRRGSTESNESDNKDVDFKAELRELEEKYKAAMMTSAQLDNEKQSLVYQVELLKDQLEEQDEGYTELQREFKDKCRDFDFQKRDLKNMEHELSILKQQLEIKDRLIEESGFVIVSNDKGEPVLEKSSTQSSSSNGPLPTGAVLVSTETRDFLEKAGGGTLGTSINDRHTNTLSVDNKAGQLASPTVSSSSVSAAVNSDRKVEDKTDGILGDGGDERSRSKDDQGKDRASDEALHDSSDVSTNKSISREHDLSRGGGSADGSFLAVESKVPRNDSGIAPDDMGAGDQSLGRGETGLNREDSGLPGEVPSVTVSKDKKGGSGEDSDGEESDEGDEFYDAQSLPSPMHTAGEKEDRPPVDINEGSSVDGEEFVGQTIVVREENVFAERSERASVVVENVTETESSTDVRDENDDEKVEDVKDEGPQEEITESTGVETTESTGQESCPAMTTTQEGKADGEFSVDEGEPMGEKTSDVVAEIDQKEENVQDVEKQESEDLEPASPDKQNSDAKSEEQQGSEPVEDIGTPVTQDEGEKYRETSSDTQADSSKDTIDNAEEIIDKSNEEITDRSKEKSNDDMGTEKEENTQEISEQVVEDTPQGNPDKDSLQSEQKEHIKDEERENQEKDKESIEHEATVPQEGEKSVGESKAADECNLGEDTSSVEQQEKDEDGEKREKEADSLSPLKEKSKVMDRTSSMVGSEASDGAGLDDYDLDDIDDILNTDAPPDAEQEEDEGVSKDTSEGATSKVMEKTEQKSESKEEEVKGGKSEGDGSKTDSKAKSKADKKQAKKDGKEKGSKKEKDGAHESKEKASKKEKDGGHEGKEKSKSSKKDSAHEGKPEKGRHSKKEKSKGEAHEVVAEEDKLSKAESQSSLEPEDLEGALDKQMAESGAHKKKKFTFFKKVFK